MKFATKLSLGCIALLSCALGAAGLLLTGQSFSGSLASTRTALQAQQEPAGKGKVRAGTHHLSGHGQRTV